MPRGFYKADLCNSNNKGNRSINLEKLYKKWMILKINTSNNKW